MSLLPTLVNNLRPKSDFDKNELRASRYGALNFYLSETSNPEGIVSPELREQSFASMGKVMQVPVINYDAGVTIGNSRTLTIADDLNTSALVTVTFSTFAWGYTMTPSLYHNNEIDYQRDWAVSFWKYIYKFLDDLDSLCIAGLDANKSKVFAELLGLYSAYANTVVVPNAQRDQILGDVEQIMQGNDFYGQINLIGNMGLSKLVSDLKQSGVYNAENKQMELLGKVLHYTNRISNPEGKNATMYAVNPGNVGMLFRVEREALFARKSRTGHEWGVTAVPGTDIPLGTYYYEDVVNASADHGGASADMDRVMKEFHGFAIDVGLVHAYNSSDTTLAQPIVKLTINTAATDADVTAPVLSTVTSAALGSLILNFSEVLCKDKAGTLMDATTFKSLLSLNLALAGAVVSAVATTDYKSYTVTINPTTNLAAADDLLVAAGAYDANGVALAAITAGTITVNGGATAWVKA